MTIQNDTDFEAEYTEEVEIVGYDFGMSRRSFMQVLGAGLLISVAAPAIGQQRRGGGGGGGGGQQSVAARVHIGRDGVITILSGKIEMGQGSRAQLAQSAAEELRVPVTQVKTILGDTALVPDDGITAGSRTTPSTVPAVRQGAAAARQVLAQLAAGRWNVDVTTVEARDGRIVHPITQRALTYAELAQAEELPRAMQQAIPQNIELTATRSWKVMGTSHRRPNGRDLIVGAHKFPSDLVRPGMLYAKILRPPTFGAKLTEIDLEPVKAMKDVVVVRDGAFVGVAAPTTHRARQALDAIAATAKWEPSPHPSSTAVYDHLRRRAQGIPASSFGNELAQAAKRLKQSYHVAYVQHAPLETRAALAEWEGGRLTIWSGTQSPFGYRNEISRAFGLQGDAVRVIVPDFGSGFGGKHTAEAAIEAARLARAANKPVSIHWTREEEFTWAYFRPAAVIDIEASLNETGTLTSWHHININSGGASIDTPYRAGRTASRSVGSDAPLRQGSYRALAATANNFAREVFMDELATAASADPFDFRMKHMENPRIRAVLEEAARQFGWREKVGQKRSDTGIGIACGTEKNSVVAACVEIGIDRTQNRIIVRRICQAYECGAIVNPENLLAQVHACIIMGLGPALWEEMRFEDGKMLNAKFSAYHVPHMSDVPPIDVHLLDRPDQPSVGGSETPIIAVAPAIANAVFHATGIRIRTMPIRLPGAKEA